MRIALTVPDGSGTAAIQDVSRIIAGTTPQQPVCTNGALTPVDAVGVSTGQDRRRLSAARYRWPTPSAPGWTTAPGSSSRWPVHIRGYIEIGVKPGMVLTSLISTSPVVGDEEVDPGQPLRVERPEGRNGQLPDRSR